MERSFAMSCAFLVVSSTTFQASVAQTHVEQPFFGIHVVDEATGLVVAISLQDLPQRDTSYTATDGRRIANDETTPMSQIHIELIRIEGDKVARSEGVTVHQPLNMPSPWKE